MARTPPGIAKLVKVVEALSAQVESRIQQENQDPRVATLEQGLKDLRCDLERQHASLLEVLNGSSDAVGAVHRLAAVEARQADVIKQLGEAEEVQKKFRHLVYQHMETAAKGAADLMTDRDKAAADILQLRADVPALAIAAVKEDISLRVKKDRKTLFKWLGALILAGISGGWLQSIWQHFHPVAEAVTTTVTTVTKP